jgi:hypothetical protein
LKWLSDVSLLIHFSGGIKVSIVLLPMLFYLSRIPVHLAAYSSNDADVPRSQGDPGEEAPNVEHPVFGVLRVDETDSRQDGLEVFVHAFHFEFVRQARKGLFRRETAGEKKIIAEDHHGLGQIQ